MSAEELNNRQVAEIFDNIADLLEIQGESRYRTVAYRRAAESIRALGRSVRDMWEGGEVESIPGVGEAIGGKIDELFRTGKVGFLENLKGQVPITLIQVLKVGDVGPKRAMRFWKDLGITDVEELEQAAITGKLAGLSGIGERTQERILDNIAAMKRRDTGRISIGLARSIGLELVGNLLKLESVEAASLAGSARRYRETVGDLDLAVSTDRASQVLQSFVQFPQVGRILGQGEVKASVELVDGLRVQVWVFNPEEYGSGLLYATGSSQHNVELRALAGKVGLSLSEHGFRDEQGKLSPCSTESAVYERLGLIWIPPELREATGEIAAASRGDLPELVELGDLKGELHSHSDWSDGGSTILEMATAAAERGMEYLVVSDHSQSLGIANGLTPERLMEQRQEIDEVQQVIGKRILLLQGAEVEILADGSLDYPDEVLAKLDLVIASLHTSLRQGPERITDRLLKAIRNRYVDVIGHPTGRLIGKRDPAELDMDRIFTEAAERGTVLEINANPERLDLRDQHARRAIELGCHLAINTDAHSPEELDLREYGVGTARRGWVTSNDVINCWAEERLMSWLRDRKGG